MQMWKMGRCGHYPWWLMHWIFKTMKEVQKGDSATAKWLLSILISSAMSEQQGRMQCAEKS